MRTETIIFRNDVDIGDPEESNFGGILWGKEWLKLEWV